MATAAMMVQAAAMVRGVSGSCATSQPSSTATTGFTYAYVATRAGLSTRSSQM